MYLKVNRYTITSLILVFLFNLNKLGAQPINGSVIKGEIIGLRNCVSVHLNNNGSRISVISKDGRFEFNNLISSVGQIDYLTIDTLYPPLKIILDNKSTITISGKLTEWPICATSGSKSQDEWEDFDEKVQKPYSKCYESYLAEMRLLTGKKSIPEWKNVLHNFTGIDSLRIALAEEKYRKEVVKYHRDTLTWICLHHDALYAPYLILRWWPKQDLLGAYNGLTLDVQSSFYGQQLKQAAKP